MIRILSRFQTLALLPAFLGIDTTRHLSEGWPQGIGTQPQRERGAPHREERAPKRLRSQIEDVRAHLNDVRDALGSSESPACRDTASLALALLVERFDQQLPQFLECAGSCRATAARLEEFVDALNRLESELVACRRTRSLGKWLLERQSGFKGSLGTEGKFYSNPGGLSEPVGQSAELSSVFDVTLGGTYRGERSWHAADVAASFALFRDVANEFDHRVSQENVFQVGAQSFRFSAGMEKRSEWLWNSEQRGIHDTHKVEVGWRRVPASSRAVEVLAHYQNEAWRPSVWSRRVLGVESSYVLSESLHDDFKLRGAFARETLQGLDASVWVSAVGLVYERKGASFSSARMRLGLQDRRVKDLGAGLWPDFELQLESRDHFLRGLYPRFSLMLSPDSTPWSPHTLLGKSSWGFKYALSPFEFDLDLSIAQAFHRALPGGRRDDRMAELVMGPRYKFSESASLALPIRFTRFWILRSQTDPATPGFNYPSTSYSDFEAALRIQYDF